MVRKIPQTATRTAMDSVLDLSTLAFGSVFDAEDSDYEVPEDIVSFIGGGGVGISL